MKRKIYCSNVHLRIIENLITSVYNCVLSLLPLQTYGSLLATILEGVCGLRESTFDALCVDLESRLLRPCSST